MHAQALFFNKALIFPSSLLQIGTFTTHDGEYFMEPLMGAEGEPYASEHSKPHLVYRQGRTGEAPPAEPCAASGNRLQRD